VHSPVTSSLSSPIILLSTLFSNTLSLFYLLMCKTNFHNRTRLQTNIFFHTLILIF
jgi:hypothetical protein